MRCENTSFATAEQAPETERRNKHKHSLSEQFVRSLSKGSNGINSRGLKLQKVETKTRRITDETEIKPRLTRNSINTQIRMRANIKQTSKEFNDNYFFSRSPKKNALAISSKQSNKIDSYERVEERYKETESGKDLNKCPTYWGGFVFRPYYFEFWEGHDNRLNKRKVYELQNQKWVEYFLQP